MFKLSQLIITSIFFALLTFELTLRAEEHPLVGVNLVGVNYPPLPEKIAPISGWLIKAPYAIEKVSIQGKQLLLLSRLIERDSQGSPFFEVVNVLFLPPFNPEIEEIAEGSSCSVNGQNDPNVIVIIKSEDRDTQFLTQARQAWRVEGEKFNEINVIDHQFKCENSAFGF